MPQPLRRVRQRIPKADIRPPRVLLHLPFLGVAALLVVFAVAVGWAFFMGVIIGQGQNPAERVNAMLHESPREMPPPPLPTTGEGVAELLDRPLPLRNDDRGGDGGGDAARSTTAPTAPTGQPEAGEEGRQAQGTQAASGEQPQATTDQAQPGQTAAQQPKASAYPFARPQGESLAAWGIQPGGAAKPAPQSESRERAKAGSAVRETPAAPERTGQKPTPKAEPKFDYVYQAAAFRDKDDGDALRARLEEKGLRTRLQKSGKVYLVQVLLRGSEREAENVRETLRRMGLGKPIRLSKKAVR